MASLRDFIGARCPRCTRDILQQAPSKNRMPTEHAWCPTCQAVMSLEELTAPRGKRPGLLRKLFGGKPNHL